jgi:TRAP-type C4-dicarboxylate transport system substrate-binding protein
MRAEWQNLEEQSQRQATKAGVTISSIDRKALEDATQPLRDKLHADPELGQLIDRIQAEQ